MLQTLLYPFEFPDQGKSGILHFSNHDIDNGTDETRRIVIKPGIMHQQQCTWQICKAPLKPALDILFGNIMTAQQNPLPNTGTCKTHRLQADIAQDR